MSNEETLLTTTDNPFNPFTHYRDWYHWDTLNGYNTCGLLARTVMSSESLNDGELRAAMNTIVRINLSGKHILVTEKSFPVLFKQESIESK